MNQARTTKQGCCFKRPNFIVVNCYRNLYSRYQSVKSRKTGCWCRILSLVQDQIAGARLVVTGCQDWWSLVQEWQLLLLDWQSLVQEDSCCSRMVVCCAVSEGTKTFGISLKRAVRFRVWQSGLLYLAISEGVGIDFLSQP